MGQIPGSVTYYLLYEISHFSYILWMDLDEKNSTIVVAGIYEWTSISLMLILDLMNLIMIKL